MPQLLPAPPEGHRSAFLHFSKRLRERFGKGLDPLSYWWRWTVSIERGGAGEAIFRGRLDRRGRRLWEVDVEGSAGFVVYDHNSAVIVTIMTDNETIKCGSKGRRRIKGGFTNVVR